MKLKKILCAGCVGLSSLVTGGPTCGGHLALPDAGTLEFIAESNQPPEPRFYSGTFVASQSGFISKKNPNMISSIQQPDILRASLEVVSPYERETIFLYFDLSEVPNDIRTTKANLILTADNAPSSQQGISNWNLHIQGVSSPWDQEALSSNNSPFFKGGNGTHGDWGYDFNTIPGPGEEITINLNYLLAGNPYLGGDPEEGRKIVDAWIDSSEHSNYGVYIGVGKQAGDFSSDNGLLRTFDRTAYPPRLEIEGRNYDVLKPKF